MAELKSLPETEDAYLVYIVPRNDCDAGLELNKLDPTYCKAVSAAMAAGVKVRVFGLSFNECGAIDYNKELKFYCPEV